MTTSAQTIARKNIKFKYYLLNLHNQKDECRYVDDLLHS